MERKSVKETLEGGEGEREGGRKRGRERRRTTSDLIYF